MPIPQRRSSADKEEKMNNEQYVQYPQEQDNKVLSDFKKFLGLEHFGWKFGAIMTLIAAVMMFLASIIMMISGAVVLANANTQQFGGMPAAANASILIMGITYMIISVTLIPETVICFIMIKKVEYYQSTTDTDISIARTRCTSVGMMVFCILFNTLAAIFFIINFVKTKNNAAEFDRIEAEQKGTL